MLFVLIGAQLACGTSVSSQKKPNMINAAQYNQHMNVLFEHLQLIDVPQVVEACTDQWYNQTLSQVNDSVVRLGVVEGEYHWHKHEQEDEFFFVLSGRLFIDLEDRIIELGPHQGTTITKNVLHRPRAPHKTVMLMVETSNIDPIGSGGDVNG